MDERELIARLQKRDEAAFEELIRQYEKKVYSLCFRMCGNSEDAEEAAQDAFLALWRGIDRFRQESSLSTWIYRLATNACIDTLRRRKKQSGSVSLDDEELFVDAVDTSPQPQETVEHREAQKLLQEGLSALVIPAPEVCVVANIGLEHTAILGDTVEKIAAEKCGIIKHGSHAVLFGQSEGVENVAREKCAQEDVALTITAQEKLERISSSLDGQEFKYRGRGPYHLRLLGEYQLLNALTVIDVCNALRSRGWDKLTDEAIDEGLSHAQWPGRLELLRRGPDFIVDGAHNPQCVDALMDSLAALYGDKKLIFLTGVLRDKDWHQMLRRALPLAKAFVVITPPSARALDENELAAWLNAQGVQAVPAKDTDDGVRRALALAGEDDAICSWGSLYFTGEVRRVLTEQ